MNTFQTPSLGKRLLCVLYDGLLLVAVLLVASFPIAGLISPLEPALARHIQQVYVLLIAGVYFTVFWRKGQTLAMKTWKIRMATLDGQPLSWPRAWARYGLALLNLLCLGLGWWGAWLRRDRQFLHDHLAGTRLTGY